MRSFVNNEKSSTVKYRFNGRCHTKSWRTIFQLLVRMCALKRCGSNRCKNAQNIQLEINRTERLIARNDSEKLLLIELRPCCSRLLIENLAIKKIDTFATKASQYNHTTGEYSKKQLSDRWNDIEGLRIQRDLYSAFLIGNTKDGSCQVLQSFSPS